MDLLMDLGTANFRAAIAGGNEIISEPSFVARDGADRTIIGLEALQMVGRNPEFVDITTPMERGVIRDIQAVVQIVQYCVKRFMSHGFARKFNLTIAIPSGLTQVEQRAVEEAGKMAGARSVKLVDASVAAALGAGLPIQQPTGCLVVNLGAGVTEATALSMNGVVGSGRLGIGGRDIDKAIVERIRKEYSLLLGLRSAEQLKRRFGESHEPITELEVRGRSLRTGLPESLMVPRGVINGQFSLYCQTIVDLIVQTMSTCPPEIAGDITERGIVLVGGGALTTGLREQLMTHVDVPVIVAEKPEASVILGLSQMERGKGGRRSGLKTDSVNRLGFGLNRITSGLKKAAGSEEGLENHEE
jgi:rod shape-determining protein MreB and related proteins